MGKAAIAGISLILVVGVVIGTVTFVNRGKGPDPGAASGAQPAQGGGIAGGMKAAESLCAPADFRDDCMETLRPVAQKDEKASPMQLVAAAFEATLDQVKKSLDQSGALEKDASDDYDKMALDSCKVLMDCAIYELKEAIEKVRTKETDSMEELLDDLNTWLSSVIADSQSCLDDLHKPELKDKMQKVLDKTDKLTVNALAIVDEITTILGSFNISLGGMFSFGGGGEAHRRLLSEEENPSWVSAAERKLMAAGANPPPNAVVAKDGSGKFKTITDAINAYPANNQGKYVIHVKEGIYEEYVTVPKKATNIYMYGDGHDKTIIRGDKNFKLKGIPTMQTATVAVMGNGFTATDIGFENTAGPEGHQAVALRVQSDLSIFTRCRMDGYQDTFYYQSLRSFYHDCIIYGTIDFMFGRGTAFVQNSKIISRMPLDNQFNTVTADGRQNRRARTGLVLQNCDIIADAKLEPNKAKINSYLGRPWSAYSTTMVMECNIGDFLLPEGWMKWDEKTGYENTCEYREYGNRGPGADTSKRVNWKGFRAFTDPKQAEKYTIQRFARGAIRSLRPSGVPFQFGLGAQ